MSPSLFWCLKCQTLIMLQNTIGINESILSLSKSLVFFQYDNSSYVSCVVVELKGRTSSTPNGPLLVWCLLPSRYHFSQSASQCNKCLRMPRRKLPRISHHHTLDLYIICVQYSHVWVPIQTCLFLPPFISLFLPQSLYPTHEFTL